MEDLCNVFLKLERDFRPSREYRGAAHSDYVTDKAEEFTEVLGVISALSEVAELQSQIKLIHDALLHNGS